MFLFCFFNFIFQTYIPGAYYSSFRCSCVNMLASDMFKALFFFLFCFCHPQIFPFFILICFVFLMVLDVISVVTLSWSTPRCKGCISGEFFCIRHKDNDLVWSVGIDRKPLQCRVRILSCGHKLITSAGVILIRTRVILPPAAGFYLVCTNNLYFTDKIYKKKKTPYFPPLCYFYVSVCNAVNSHPWPSLVF